jgi:TolB-like protein/tetratricopeptide (TPR) repeat protein
MQFCFADCILDAERRELLRAGLSVPVEPQVFDLLIYIVRNRDRVVGRDELIAAVWDGRIVSESTLTSRINAARRVIGDNGEAQRLIRTLSRKGVRFVGELATPAVAPITGDSRPSIAVLPFENLSGDREQDYFADGMVEEIITGLSRIKWLFVISRNSSFSYRGRPVDVKTIGQELGVRYVLEGSVRRAGDNVRVTGQLVEAETAHNVWADRYEGSLSDIFALQDELTMNVISAVEPTLRRAEIERARRRRPDNLDAYDLYLRALPHASTAMPADADKAVVLLERALELEPDYAAAHGFLAWCHEQRYLRGGLGHDARKSACFHAHAAIQTGADDAMALAMGGFVIGAMERDYDRALEALDRSIALGPSSALAFGFSATVRAWRGDYATAIAHGLMGIRLGPYDPLIYLPCVGLAYAYYFSGGYAAAAEAAGRAVSANPSFSVPRYLHAASLHRLGRSDEAKEIAKVLLLLQPGFTVSGLVAGNITAPERMQSLAETLIEIGLPA